MKKRIQVVRSLALLKQATIWIALAWTGLIISFVLLIGLGEHNEVFEVARSQAVALFQKDVLYRLWNSEQGGIYVLASDKTPPNPYLAGNPDRDMTTTTGRQLTLVNPAYMTRMVHELGLKELGLQGHITSLKPLRPENAPDEWEKKALTKIAQGQTNVSEIVTVNGVRSLRFMGGLVTQKPCLKCHEKQGYREGDVRGGISVGVSLAAPWVMAKHKNGLLFSLGLSGVWLFGIAGITVSHKWASARAWERHQAHTALVAGERKFRSVFETSHTGMVLVDLQGVILLVNGAFAEMIGYAPATLSGGSFEQCIPSGARHGFALKMTSLIDGGIPCLQMENSFLHKEGHIVWGSMTLDIVRDDDSRPVYLTGQIQDVTARKKAEDALHLSERRYRLISQNTWDVIWTIDLATWRYTFVSPSVEKLRGYTVEEVMGQTMQDALTPESNRVVSALIAQSLEAYRAGDKSVSTQTHQLDLRRKDGSILKAQVLTTLLTDEAGCVTELLGTTRDISERVRAEEALREREFWLSKSQRVARLGSYVLDFKTGFWNGTDILDEVFGIGADFCRSIEGWLNFVHPDDRADMTGYFRNEIMTQKKPFSKTYRIQRVSDKCERWVMGAGELVLDTDGTLLKMFGTIQDITDYKLLEDQLRQSQKMEAVGRLAGGIAHDFNNILTSIIINAGLLQNDPGLKAETQISIKDIELEATRAANLTRQLLLFSRRQVIQIKPLDLNRVLRDLMNMLGRLLGEHIALEFQEASDLSLIEADTGMMEQVVLNLSVNARDAMPNGGRLRLGTSMVEIDSQVARANPEARKGRFACLLVSDTGCGMDELTLKRVFEPFFTTKEVGKGTGLGLATVYGIVKQHQGWTEVESAPGQGTVFRIFLPCTTAPAALEPSSPIRIDSRNGHETILLVEDEPAVRRMVALCLRRSGYHVLEASNGMEAMTLWSKESKRIDLLFSDMVMPEGMTGLELAARLRKENRSLKVIISSGYSLEISDRDTSKDLGITYLTKPYKIFALAVAVRKCLDEPVENGARCRV